MSGPRLLRLIHSWRRQETHSFLPWQRRWFQRFSLVLLLSLSTIGLQQRIQQERAQRDKQLQQAIEIMASQWNTLSATAYDWAHWDETHAFARGEAPGYPARNLQVANGLSSVAPVVMIIDQNGRLLTLQGRSGPSSWSDDPLVQCSLNHSSRLLLQQQMRGISCTELPGKDVWIGVIEPITDTREMQPVSGLMVLLAPLRHPSQGPTLQALMHQLERQVNLEIPGPRALKLHGHKLWGTDGRVLTLRPESVWERGLISFGADLTISSSFLLVFLIARCSVMLQHRQRLLHQRKQERISRRRLRDARYQLEALFSDLPFQERERALRSLVHSAADPIDDLARLIEVYAAILRRGQGNPITEPGPLFAPMRDCHGQLKRLLVLSGPNPKLEVYQQALQGWSSLPTGLRSSLGLQFELTSKHWLEPESLQALLSAIEHNHIPAELCTFTIAADELNRPEAKIILHKLHDTGFGLALIHVASGIDPRTPMGELPFTEIQLNQPATTNPPLAQTQQDLLIALIHLGQAKGLKVNITGINNKQILSILKNLKINLFSGPIIGGPAKDPADCLVSPSSI